MKIEKICEYFNDIGILQLENINSFLQIYTQISQNKYKNKSDKLILALFSYITLASKNEQQLYDICKSIVNSFSNNLILYRYRALTMLNNIFKNKLHSKYIFFLSKLNSFIYNKKRKENKYIYLNPISKIKNSNDQKELYSFDLVNEKNIKFNNTSMEKNNNIRLNPKPKRNIKIKRKFNNYRELYNSSDENKECTFSPKINLNYSPNYKIKTNNDINYNSDFLSSYNYNNDNNDNSFNNKYIPFKNSVKYGYNDKINDEIEKMLTNMSKYSNNQNNTKYLPIKTKYRKQINNIYPSISYNEFPSFPNINDSNYNNINGNIGEYHYYDEDYNFYENQKDHIQKVQDRILQLKLKKMEKMSKECTFSPEINPIPKYLNINKINNRNNLTEYNISHRNYLKNYNNNNIVNNSLNISNYSKNVSKNKSNKLNEEYADDYYNIYPKQLNTKYKKRPRSYSGSKNDNKYSVYKARKEELSKLFKEQYPFMPNVKYNKNIQIKSTFDERQEKFIKDKEKLYKQKEEEEKKQIEEMKRNRSKAVSKEVVKRLYDNEAVKIKEKIQKEKEEKSKKKNIIDWSKKRKKYNQLFPEDFKNQKFKKNKINIVNKKERNEMDFNSFKKNSKENRNINTKDDNINGNEGNNIIDFSTFSKDKQLENNNKNVGKKDKAIDLNPIKKSKIDKNISNKNITSNEKRKKREINKDKKILMDKIKDEHVIGFKNNISNNNSNYNIMNNNSINSLNDDEFGINKAKEKINNDGNNHFKEYQSSSSINLEERKKKFEENNNLLDLMNNKGEIKSTAFQEIMNSQYNK